MLEIEVVEVRGRCPVSKVGNTPSNNKLALITIGATIVGLMLLTIAIALWMLVSVVKEAK